jgi:ABC-type iron transport system FetAB permease component
MRTCTIFFIIGTLLIISGFVTGMVFNLFQPTILIWFLGIITTWTSAVISEKIDELKEETERKEQKLKNKEPVNAN